MEKALEEENMRKNLQKLEHQREHYTQQAQILADQKLRIDSQMMSTL